SGEPDRGVVHDDVGDPVLTLDVLREVDEGVGVGDVEVVYRCGRAAFLAQAGGLLGACGVDVGEDDVASEFGEGPCRFAADTAARSGDDREPACERLPGAETSCSREALGDETNTVEGGEEVAYVLGDVGGV